MEKQLTLSSETALVELEIHGNVRVKGADGMDVVVETKHEDAELVLQTTNEGVNVQCSADCSVTVPRKARIQAEVHGNASFKALEGELQLEEIHGNLDLRSVGATQLEVVHGNLANKFTHAIPAARRAAGF